jgi:hypothetical protein
MGSFLPRDCDICGKEVGRSDDYNFVWKSNLQQLKLPDNIDFKVSITLPYIGIETWIHSIQMHGGHYKHFEQKYYKSVYVGYPPIIRETYAQHLKDTTRNYDYWDKRNKLLIVCYQELIEELELQLENGYISKINYNSWKDNKDYYVRVPINPLAYWVSPSPEIPKQFRHYLIADW